MIKNVVVSNSYTEIIKASDTTVANLGIYFCNSTGTNADVIDLFVMSEGEGPTNETKVISKLYIPPGETFMFGHEKFILDPGESIGALAQVGGRISATVTFTGV